MKQLDENLGALSVTLGPEHLARLDAASRIQFGFPHDFLSPEFIRGPIYGGTHDRIDNHRPR